MTSPLTPTRILDPKALAQTATSTNLGDAVSVIAGEINTYLQVREQERTKRRQIQAWENTQLAQINARTRIVQDTVTKVFDERHQLIYPLLQAIEHATTARDNDQLTLLLGHLNNVLATDALRDIADLATLELTVENPEAVIRV